MTTTATYTRLNDGAWGLRVAGAAAPGQQVQVTTRDGRVKTETVGAIVWSQNGVTVASTARAEARPMQQPVQQPVQPPVQPVEPPPARVQPDLEQIIRDLETALAGLKALRAA